MRYSPAERGRCMYCGREYQYKAFHTMDNRSIRTHTRNGKRCPGSGCRKLRPNEEPRGTNA